MHNEGLISFFFGIAYHISNLMRIRVGKGFDVVGVGAGDRTYAALLHPGSFSNGMSVFLNLPPRREVNAFAKWVHGLRWAWRYVRLF